MATYTTQNYLNTFKHKLGNLKVNNIPKFLNTPLNEFGKIGIKKSGNNNSN